MPDLRVLLTDDVSPTDLAAARRLMDLAFGDRFSDHDWEHSLGGFHVVLMDGSDLVAHAAVVRRNLEVDGQSFSTGYVEAVATLPSRQGQGLGSLVMTEATAVVRERFAMGALSTNRHAFYERLGWERWLGPTYVRGGEETIRTEDEDDGVMVLRLRPSAHLDLHAPISCEARPGDDW